MVFCCPIQYLQQAGFMVSTAGHKKGYENMNYSTLPDYGLLTGLSIVTVIMERNGYIVNCRIFYQSFHAVCT